jgi:hypothetical protein
MFRSVKSGAAVVCRSCQTLGNMISHRKWLTGAAAALAGFLAPAFLAVAVAAKLDRIAPAQVERLLPLAFPVFSAIVIVVSLLITEFARLRGVHWREGELKLPWAQQRLMLSWCPAILGLAYVVVAFIFVYVLFAVGPVSWSMNEPLSKHEAVGFSLYMSMALFFLPFLVSATRMPGAYVEHFHPRLSRNRVA